MSYWDSFGYEWLKWPNVQDDALENERVFTSKTGLMPHHVKGKTVLDVGCGTGRFIMTMLDWEAKKVHGIEPSDAYYVAKENVRWYANMGDEVYKESIESFCSGSVIHKYDIVYCIGVLHHTPNPRESFKRIAKLVKPGGTLHVWVYKKMDYWSKITDFYRIFTTRMPWWMLRQVCKLAGPWEYVRRIPYMGKYVWLLFPCSMHPKWECRVLDQFDWLSPKYQWQHTTEEVMTWFVEEGFVDITTCKIPVSVKGRRPK